MTKLHELVYHSTLPSQKHILVKNRTFIVDSDVRNMNFIYVDIFIEVSITQIQMFTRKYQGDIIYELISLFILIL